MLLAASGQLVTTPFLFDNKTKQLKVDMEIEEKAAQLVRFFFSSNNTGVVFRICAEGALSVRSNL